MSEEMVIVRMFSNELEANMARAELEAADIHCLILSDVPGEDTPHLSFAQGVHLAVHRRDQETAESILTSHGRGSPS